MRIGLTLVGIGVGVVVVVVDVVVGVGAGGLYLLLWVSNQNFTSKFDTYWSASNNNNIFTFKKSSVRSGQGN